MHNDAVKLRSGAVQREANPTEQRLSLNVQPGLPGTTASTACYAPASTTRFGQSIHKPKMSRDADVTGATGLFLNPKIEFMREDLVLGLQSASCWQSAELVFADFQLKAFPLRMSESVVVPVATKIVPLRRAAAQAECSHCIVTIRGAGYGGRRPDQEQCCPVHRQCNR